MGNSTFDVHINGSDFHNYTTDVGTDAGIFVSNYSDRCCAFDYFSNITCVMDRYSSGTLAAYTLPMAGYMGTVSR